MFALTFGEETGDSQDDRQQDPLTARVSQIRSLREAVKVTVENGGAQFKGQRAHVTPHIALVIALEAAVSDETWLGAWENLRKRWRFLELLKNAWFADAELAHRRLAANENALDYLLDGEAQNIRDERLVRSGVDLSSAWYAAPLTGTVEEKREGRLYFDHDPLDGEVDLDEYAEPKRWLPNLSPLYISAMTTSMESWIKARSLFPWTSINTDSYVTGDRKAAEGIGPAAAAAGTGALAAADQTKIVNNLLGCFDCFPPSLTATRTAHHMAGVAARHVVEHFQYVPDIQPAWRTGIAAEFLTSWRARIQTDIQKNTGPQVKKAKSNKGAAKPNPSRDTSGLTALKDDWTTVSASYNTYITAFSGALV